MVFSILLLNFPELWSMIQILSLKIVTSEYHHKVRNPHASKNFQFFPQKSEKGCGVLCPMPLPIYLVWRKTVLQDIRAEMALVYAQHKAVYAQNLRLREAGEADLLVTRPTNYVAG